jgi:hypothetical protein
MESGILYVVYNEWIVNPETEKMPYKIGITKNSVAERYYGLGLKMPGNFETLFAYKIKDCAKAEQAIHTILNKYCVNGEWFELTQKELDFIQNICETMDGVIVTEEIEKEIQNETEEGNINYPEENNQNNIKKHKIEYGGIIEYIPDKITFRKRLLKYHKANLTLIYDDGHSENGIWDASNITERSNISGNIRSGYLRDWKEKGIMKGIFEVKDI